MFPDWYITRSALILNDNLLVLSDSAACQIHLVGAKMTEKQINNTRMQYEALEYIADAVK